MATPKTKLWQKDWLIALIIAIVFLILFNSNTLQSLERFAYDWGVRSSQSEPNENIAVIAIDQESLNNLGRWPWPRDLHSQMVDLLSDSGAKAIGFTTFFSEEQIDPGYVYIDEMRTALAKSQLLKGGRDAQGNKTILAGPLLSKLAKGNNLNDFAAVEKPIVELYGQMSDSLSVLNVDKQLAISMKKSSKVLLPMIFHIGVPQGNPDIEMPLAISKYAIKNVEITDTVAANDFFAPETYFIEPTIDILARQSQGIGHLTAIPDVDGGIRSEPLVFSYFDEYYPSLSLLLAAKSLNLSTKDITLNVGEGVTIGNLKIATDNNFQMQTFFYNNKNNQAAFQIDSFYDVLVGNIPADKYKNKIVLIGATAAGLGSSQLTPIDSTMAPVVTLAHSVSSILNEDFYTVPTWSLMASLGVFLLITLFLMFVLPRLSAKGGAVITLVLLLALIAAHYFMMTTQSKWIQLMIPAALLVVGYLVSTTKRFFVSERGKLSSDLESSESNRMLGLAFQGQGQLDMAFEKFRKCSKDEDLSEPLYNLALDYERKRQFAKAGNVYSYIAEFAPEFKDIQQRLTRSKKMEDTIMLGGSGGAATANGTLVLEGEDVAKPMLGRYQVEKELGKGAMGVVYLGKDPKISRTVAIKTMALSQEFEEDELKDVTERFFREAETAGRLNHPNIVTIYDAGEEHDLAYIAMEFLKGHDLGNKTKPGSLLPLEVVIDITAKCADALHYAHQQSVVHRDIKPANIMFHQESGELKITDFGIARITDTSKTKTGMVLGSPSYMSPEQLSGKHVDGRSDLFSLGVMFYQMITGSLPFKADSMAALMFKIANEKHASVKEHNPQLPASIDAFIDLALEKDPSKRFQNGDIMAKALKQLN